MLRREGFAISPREGQNSFTRRGGDGEANKKGDCVGAAGDLVGLVASPSEIGKNDVKERGKGGGKMIRASSSPSVDDGGGGSTLIFARGPV